MVNHTIACFIDQEHDHKFCSATDFFLLYFLFSICWIMIQYNIWNEERRGWGRGQRNEKDEIVLSSGLSSTCIIFLKLSFLFKVPVLLWTEIKSYGSLYFFKSRGSRDC